MNEVEEQIEDQVEQARALPSFLPGELFYSERIELPVGVAVNELESAIETQLEANSPFAMEQLCFGAVIDREQSKAFVYAAFNERLQEVEDFNRSSSAHYPSFLPFLRFNAEHPCIITGIADKQLSLIIFDEAGMLPSEVHSVPFDGKSDDPLALAKFRADLLRDMPWVKTPLSDHVFVWEKTAENWKHQKSFHSKHVFGGDTGGDLLLELSSVEASFADIREREIKRRELSAAKWNNLLWLTSLGSLSGFFVISLFFFGNWVWSIGLQSKMEAVQERQAMVEAIEAKERNLQVFESGSAAQLQPLAMLDLVNRVRPDGVFFGEVSAFEGNQLQIDGLAETDGTALINQFRDQLKQLNSLETVVVEITRINQGVSYFFRANLKFKELELADVGGHQ